MEQQKKNTECLNNRKGIIIMDEPTSALDKDTQKEVMKNIYEEVTDKLFVLITHDKSMLYDCDFIYKLTDGKLVEGGRV